MTEDKPDAQNELGEAKMAEKNHVNERRHGKLGSTHEQSPSPEELRAAAEAYHALGIAVVPFRIWWNKETGQYEKKNIGLWAKWQTEPQTDEEFEALDWRGANGFGVILGTEAGNSCYLGVIDFDTKGNVSEEGKARGEGFLKDLPVTQTQQTVNKGLHLVYWSRKKPRTDGFFHDDAGLELLGEKKLCLMAPSYGYRMLNDNSPTEIENLEETFYGVLRKYGFKPSEEAEEVEEQNQDRENSCSFDITKIVDVTKLTKTGPDEYQGSHPIHDSTTEKNFTLNTRTNSWHCFRHNSGGGALQYLAMKEGIIKCEQAKKGALRGKKFKQVLQVAVASGLIDKEVAEQDEKKESQADRLVKLCLAQDAELFVDQYGTPFIRYVETFNEGLRYCAIDGEFDSFSANTERIERIAIPEKVPETPQIAQYRKRFVNCPIHSKRFKTWLANLFWDAEGKAPGSEGLASAILVLMGKASAEGKEYRLYNRVAPSEDGIWLDMADEGWRAIKITAAGWEIIDNPPILFRRYNHQKPLVIPEKCSLSEARENVEKIFHYLNIKKDDEKSKLMFLCNIISYLIPTIPHPILVIYGPQGAAKTWLCIIIRRLLDPSDIEVLTLPRDERELAQQLNHHWLAFYDNMTYLPQWASDLFCRVVTGAGFSKRELYTDDDDVIYAIKRCLALNGINIAARKGDLLDRSTLLPVERIGEKDRKTEAELNEGFDKDKAAILGGMLTALSEALRIYPVINLKEYSRMADFNRYGCAIAQALGKTIEDFLDIYKQKVEQQNEEAINADPVALALLDFCQIHFRRTKEGKLTHENWSGTPTRLFQQVTNHAQTMGTRIDPKHWPTATHAFTRRINNASASLQALGFEVTTKPGTPREVIISPGKQAKLLPEYAEPDENQPVSQNTEECTCEDLARQVPEEDEGGPHHVHSVDEQPFFPQCYFCGQPIWTDAWVANHFTENKPAHRECYEKKFGELKNKEGA
jgi:hypothetical protein